MVQSREADKPGEAARRRNALPSLPPSPDAPAHVLIEADLGKHLELRATSVFPGADLNSVQRPSTPPRKNEGEGDGGPDGGTDRLQSEAIPHAVHETQADGKLWTERAEAAERRARFAELRLRAMEAQVETLTRHLEEDSRLGWRKAVRLLRSIPPYCRFALKALGGDRTNKSSEKGASATK
jgi:hypothetical protein